MTQANSPAQLPNFDLYSLIQDMPGFVIIKDLNSNYLNANTHTIEEFGLKNADSLFGYSDLTIPHPIANNGQFYRDLDFDVITSGTTTAGICTFPFQGKMQLYQFKKSILKDVNGNDLGIFSQAIECIDPKLTHLFQHSLIELRLKLNYSVKNHQIILIKDYPGICLSALQSNCLFYLIRRQKVKEIANLLNQPINLLSEEIENIKLQIKADNIEDIFDIATERNYLNIMPPSILALIKQQNVALNDQTGLINVSVKHKNISQHLTLRESDCVKLLLKGHKFKEIANIMNLSPRTIETHINNIKTKLNCRDKAELIIKLKDMM